MSRPLHVLVIGTGIAGLTAAILAHRKGHAVTLVTKTEDPADSNSSWAQGGIVFKGSGDTPGLLARDILSAADKMALPEAVKVLAEEGPRAIQEILLDLVKVPFEKDHGKYRLTEEGAHSVKRILFSSDQTGRVIIQSLLKYLRTETKIRVLTGHMAIELITMPHHSRDPLSVYSPSLCLGAYLFSTREKKVRSHFADRVILASGGIGQVYLHSTNPLVATGDGIGLAYRAGARITNMEYTQFHPTTLAVKEAGGFLISEAVRGEGAVLRNAKGEDFTRKFDPRGSLAPRDIVSRAIQNELEKTGAECAYLLLPKMRPAEIQKRFPTIYKKCREHRIDITKEPIPVVPGFHFSCGGVLTNTHGLSTLPNLYAVGETACTGIHGANRLASTSLLEGLVFARRAVEDLERSDFRVKPLEKKIRPWEEKGLISNLDPILLKQDWQTLKSTMWNYVGVIRTRARMRRASETLRDLKSQMDHFYWNARVGRDIVELRNAIQTAILITSHALKNRRSSGCHYVVD
ncbi:MAG: L-aspartate oxidase [Spirochaetia bacterium]|nr:L-aspartate oxidase [Spirochaetia bacterium]